MFKKSSIFHQGTCNLVARKAPHHTTINLTKRFFGNENFHSQEQKTSKNPYVVFFHGFLCTAEGLFEEQITALAKAKVGFSAINTSGCNSIKEIVNKNMDFLLERIDEGERLIGVAYSMGGYVACSMLEEIMLKRRRPGMEAFVPINVNIVNVSDKERKRREELKAKVNAVDGNIEDVICKLYFHNNSSFTYSNEVKQKFANMVKKINKDIFNQHHNQILSRVEPVSALEKIIKSGVRVYAINGNNDPIVPPIVWENFIKSQPIHDNVTVRTLSPGGHLLPFEYSGEITEAIFEIIKQMTVCPDESQGPKMCL